MNNLYLHPNEVLNALGENNEGSINVLDIESDIFEKIAFDFGYGFIDLRTRQSKKFKSFLNLDALIDEDYLESISRFKKISGPNASQYYQPIKLLKENANQLYHEKVNTNMDEIENIDYKKYISKLNKALNDYKKSKEYWRQKKKEWKKKDYANTQFKKRQDDIRGAERAIKLYSKQLNNKKITTQDKTFLKDYMSRFYFLDVKRIDYSNEKIRENRKLAMQKAEKILSSNSILNKNIQPWRKISKIYMGDLFDNNTNFVSSYNFAFDRGTIERTNKKFNCNIIKFDKIKTFCTYQLYNNFRKHHKEILDFIAERSSQSVKDAIQITKESGEGTATLDIFTEIFASNDFKKKDKERHTAIEDTKMLASALIGLLQETLSETKKK